MAAVAGGTAAPIQEAIDEDRLYAKVSWRLIPFLCLCFVVAYLDRVNVGFAKLHMLNDLQWSETIYGLGAGIFFLGYVLVEVPSNIILHRVGARRWIARIMVTWAIISGATAFVSTPMQFYAARFLLGVAEAGFLPGVILYLTYWYPAQRRSRVTALFMSAIPISGIIGGPLSGWILSRFMGIGGLAAWQWMFILEAVPSLVVGVIVLFYLDDGIRQANWLGVAEKLVLERNIQSEARGKQSHTLRDAFGDKRVWLLGLVYFACAMGNYGLSFWLPSLIQATGVQDVLTIGLLTTIPFAAGVASMIWWSRRSDRHLERRWHLVIAMLVGAFGLVLSTLFGSNTLLAMAALTLASIGIQAMAPVFWSMPTAFLGGAAAAAGIAMITSIANLAGFISPYLIGWVKDATHSTNIAMYVLAGSMLAGAALVLGAIPARLVNK